MDHYEMKEIAMTIERTQANPNAIEGKTLTEAEIYYHLLPGDFVFYEELPDNVHYKVVDRIWKINRETGTAKALVRMTPATLPPAPPH